MPESTPVKRGLDPVVLSSLLTPLTIGIPFCVFQFIFGLMALKICDYRSSECNDTLAGCHCRAQNWDLLLQLGGLCTIWYFGRINTPEGSDGQKN